MPPNTSKLWWKFTLALTAIHVTAFFLRWLESPLGLERLQLGNNIGFFTYALPLYFFWKNGVYAPVLQRTGPDVMPWMVPTVLGWILVVLSWVLFYLIVGYLLSVIVSRFKRTD
jgi:hypothetical protein